MRANYPDPILRHVLEHEGGWADHPEDPGGATMKGVTLETFRHHYGDGRTKAELRAITDEQLEHVYREGYWLPVRGPQLPSGVDLAVFDAAVNSGPGLAARWLQRAVGVLEDGVVGPVTLAAVQAMPAGPTIESICNQRLARLRSRPHWPTFRRGWTRRLESVRARSHALAATRPTLAERWRRFLAAPLPSVTWR